MKPVYVILETKEKAFEFDWKVIVKIFCFQLKIVNIFKIILPIK